MSTPKIMTDSQFQFLIRLRDPTAHMFLRAQHDSANELETFHHYPFQVCGCNAAVGLREKEKEMSEENTIPLGVLTADEFITAYTDPVKIRDAYNGLFCPPSEGTPVPFRETALTYTAEQIGERMFFLEKLIAYMKVQYRFLVDVQTDKLESLSNEERIRVRKIDQERRWSVKSPNDPAPKVRKTGMSEDVRRKIEASLDDDLADILGK